eukprot:2423733-Rhodomonas_salina.2
MELRTNGSGPAFRHLVCLVTCIHVRCATSSTDVGYAAARRGNTLFPGAGSESHAKIKSKLNPRSLRKRSQIENFAAILK